MTDAGEHIETNRRMWDEVVPYHVASPFYDVESFKAGRSSLLGIERDEVGDVRGKSLLHLQCHFGLDTLSWAREGALVTGIDFSRNAVVEARRLAAELSLPARFLEANLYDLPSLLREQFDIVFTSYGAIVWLPDIHAWARVVASFVKPGGFFYIVEQHPMINTLAEDDLRFEQTYFGNERPQMHENDVDYAGAPPERQNKRAYEFQRSLGETVTALAEAGLRIDFLHEFPFCAWAQIPAMKRGDDGYYRLPEGAPEFPFLFSLKATKPA